VCSHPGFYACLSDAPKCVKCGRDPTQYRNRDSIFCFLHRSEMTSQYTTTSAFLLTDYVWRGHDHLFPNAKLFTVAGDIDESADDVQQFYVCDQCESAYQAWLESR